MIPTAKPVLYALAAVVAVLALWALYNAITARPKAEARLGRNQAEAAAESGSDAVNTVGQAGEREATSDALTRDNERSIRDAEGADDAVADPVNDAGLRSLCKRAAYRDHPKCVQYADPR